MKTALFGYKASGKTELFRALAGPQADHSDIAVVKVPEPRLLPLTKLFKTKKVTPSEIEYLDIPGGERKGGGLSQRILNQIRPYDCLLAVLDCFSGLNDPHNQYQTIESDLIISDLEVAEKRLERIKIDKQKNKDLVNPQEEKLLGQAKEFLEQEKPLRFNKELVQAPELRGFSFLSAKPILYVWNLDEDELNRTPPIEDTENQAHLSVSAKLERELAEIEDPDDRQEFINDLGLDNLALEKIIAKTYNLLGLITFLTAGEKEVRAWMIHQGATALEAAGAIHSDIQKGFIRAEVLSWKDFQRSKNFKVAREKGLLRLEGKDYLVQDGDIITFRFNI